VESVGPNARTAWRVGNRTVSLLRPTEAPAAATIQTPQLALTIDLARTAVIVIDLQNDACSPGGLADRNGDQLDAVRALIAPTNILAQTMRAVGVPVVWVGWGNRADRADLPSSLIEAFRIDGGALGNPAASQPALGLQENTWGSAVAAGLAVSDNDLLVSKHRMNGFHRTDLEDILRGLDVDTLLFAGANTEQCVLATLGAAADRGFNCVLVADCTATTSPDYCWDAALHTVSTCYGFTVRLPALVEGVSAATR
jgi:nicotinamidase-related amidase